MILLEIIIWLLYLIRNDVVSPQKFDQGIVDTNYHHHAILSDNINGTWGTAIIRWICY